MSKGKLNVYTCSGADCETVTIDRDEGVTPFMIRCTVCGLFYAYSSFYQVPVILVPTHEWYRKEDADVRPHERDHHKQGGLFLREITTGDQRMQVKEITVRAGRVFNHPYEQFSNLRPEVEMRATLAPGEDACDATKQLQAQAEELIEDHKQIMLQQIKALYRKNQIEQERTRLSKGIEEGQRRLEGLRQEEQRLIEELDKGDEGDGGDDLYGVDMP